MINLRYHIVSLVAVFLALAIGIAMGSTVISKATVSDLKTRIDKAERGIDSTKKQNRILASRLHSLQDANRATIDKLVPALVADRLKGVGLIVVFTPSVDQQYQVQTLGTLQASGATVKATIKLGPPLANLAGDDSNTRKLADVLGTTATARDSADPARLWKLAADQLGADLRATTQPATLFPTPSSTPSLPTASVPASTTTSTTTSGTSTSTGTTQPAGPPLLTRLGDAGFVDVETANKSSDIASVMAGRGYRLLVVGAPAVKPAPGTPTGLDAQFVVPLLEAIVRDGPAPLVVGSVADPNPTNADTPDAVREWFLGPIHDDKALDGRLTTVNDLESAAGQVTVVLSLQEVASGKFGQYGTGSGANALAPVA